MRAMLIDWLQEVGDEFAMTRESVHISTRFVDIVLSREECPIERLQLLGAASLLLSCKMEEVLCPRVSHFAYATDNGFTPRQIIEMEANISRILGFHLLPPTIAFWANYYMAKFDIFAKENPEGFYCLQTNDNSQPQAPPTYPILFKSDRMEDYQRFRSLMQVFDLILIDMDHLVYDMRHIVAAGIYIQVGLSLEAFSRSQISMMPDLLTLLVHLEQENSKQDFIHMIHNFIETTFGFEISVIIPAMKYISRFFFMEPQSQLPIVL